MSDDPESRHFKKILEVGNLMSSYKKLFELKPGQNKAFWGQKGPKRVGDI